MFKIFVFNIIAIIIFLLSISYNNVVISEEVDPIRDKDIITGIDYKVILDKNTNKNRFNVNTSILSSIYHYKSIDDLDSININLELKNNSKYNYYVDDILLVDNDYIIRKINYKYIDNCIVFDINKDDFDNYNSNSFIRIKIRKKYS